MSDEELSLILKPRDYADIAKLQDPGVLEQFLDQPATAIIETITGAFAVGKTALLASGGRLAQGLLKGRMYEQFAEEFKRLRDAGKIPDDFGDSKYGFQTWAELMAIIDEECPDADRLEALKAMFYAVNKVNVKDQERIVEYQLWQIARRMNSGELVVLKALNEFTHQLGNLPYSQWLQQLCIHSGLQVTELVDLHLKQLRSLLLSAEFDHANSSDGGITNLGRRLCQNIKTYQLDLEIIARTKS